MFIVASSTGAGSGSTNVSGDTVTCIIVSLKIRAYGVTQAIRVGADTCRHMLQKQTCWLIEIMAWMHINNRPIRQDDFVILYFNFAKLSHPNSL
ncbi:hypothetical protein CGA22_22720 [Pseudomonas sp. PSB18]|nr:hypothetical protein [Pseudomonas sp. PSB18]